MIAADIYKLALAMIFERPDADQDFKYFFLSFLNILLAEALPYENSYREYKGLEQLETAPYIDSMDTVVNYCDTLCRLALPFGIVSFYFQDDMDTFKSQDYRGRYIQALNECGRGAAKSVVDVYGKE